jgi:hypothetical protein
MHRVNGWIGRGKALASTQSLDSLAESQNLESALRAVELIMNDDIEGAERGLAEGNSAFHSLCKGVLGFMKATLGFEQEVMKEASEQLSAAETSAYNNHYKAQRDSHAYQSNIYDRGAEFSLCQAEAQIMSAVVGVLNESLTESIKGFYKLRKAYMTLDGLMQMENRFLKTQEVSSLTGSRNQSQESLRSVRSTKSSRSAMVNGEKENLAPAPGKDTAHANHPSGLREATATDDLGDDSDEEFYDVENGAQIMREYTGNLVRTSEDRHLNDKMSNMSLTNHSIPTTPTTSTIPAKQQSAIALQLLTVNADSTIFSNPLDIFIHSGTNLCFGLLSLLISAIPPAFSKLLFIIGFRGDRERGMRMLWQASKFSNINGGMAGLIILGWYNGFVGFCDIIPDPDPNVFEEVEGYPAVRLQALLAEMRRRYPKSHLWLIEEARMLASDRQLDKALDILAANPGKKSTLKQLEALHMFEKSLSSMHAHRYAAASTNFIACVDLNNWSQALYYYIAGAAHLEIYRSTDPNVTDTEKAQSAKLATEYFKTAPSKAGKKKMMGRQLPFDSFVIRKIAKWEAKAEALGCEFVDAVGVSPLEEMVFFWNGYKKMDVENLELSLRNLAWSETKDSFWEKEDTDERAILGVLRAVIYRNLRRHEESKSQLRTVLSLDASSMKGGNMDDWPASVAHYEMAVNLWMERREYIKIYGTDIVTIGRGAVDTKRLPPSKEDVSHDAKLVREAKTHVEKAKGWEKYSLDARIGMKVTAAGDAIKNWEGKHGLK